VKCVEKEGYDVDTCTKKVMKIPLIL